MSSLSHRSYLSVFYIYLSLQQLSTFTTMADKAILATLPKLNGSNWFEWKNMEIFLLLAGLDGIINAADIPTGSKAAEWNSKDHKVYVYFFFLIKPNYCLLIIKIKSIEKLGGSLLLSMKKTVPQCTWCSANNSIHLDMTLLLVSSSSLMPSSQLFNNLELVINQMTSKSATSS